MSVLKTFTMGATKEQLLMLFADDSVPLDTLRKCAFVCLGGDPTELGASNGAAVAPVAAKPAKASKAKPAKASKAKPVDGVAAVVAAIAATGAGFAKADVMQAASCSPAQASTAIKNAMAAGTIKNFGDRRFSRYGASMAIAKAASEAARKG